MFGANAMHVDPVGVFSILCRYPNITLPNAHKCMDIHMHSVCVCIHHAWLLLSTLIQSSHDWKLEFQHCELESVELFLRAVNFPDQQDLQ